MKDYLQEGLRSKRMSFPAYGTEFQSQSANSALGKSYQNVRSQSAVAPIAVGAASSEGQKCENCPQAALSKDPLQSAQIFLKAFDLVCYTTRSLKKFFLKRYSKKKKKKKKKKKNAFELQLVPFFCFGTHL